MGATAVQANRNRIEIYDDPYWVRFTSAIMVECLQAEIGTLAAHILLSLTRHRAG